MAATIALALACVTGGGLAAKAQTQAQTQGSLTVAGTPAIDPAPATTAAAPAGTPAALPEAVSPEQMEAGGKLFLKNCRQCHGTRGKAGVPLANNQNLADPAFLAIMIVNGRGYMPAFGEVLDDEQIAAIATFARNSWGNAFGPVTPDDVKAMR